MDSSFSIAVMSDLHFSAGGPGSEGSYVDLSASRVEKQDPIKDLHHLIAKHSLRADVLMCPGDITVAADGAGLRAAWDALQQSADLLGVSRLFAATGNHDVASRDPGNEPEIWERLKLLTPSYPSPGMEELERLRYWGDHYFVARVDGLRIVVLNTCNTHARGEKEYARGRVTDYTIDRILEMTPTDESVRMNVLLCHHHPLKYPDLDQSIADYSEMVQGPKLLERLQQNGQPWLVIHGHKHYPRIGYASGSGETPTIFSAGSLSAVLSPVYFDTAVNQFYIIDVDLADVRRLGMVGTVRSWSWVKSAGWFETEPSEPQGGRIISGSGFGYRSNLRELGEGISELVDDGVATQWSAVEAKFPNLKYMLYRDRQQLMALLETKGIRAIGGNILNPAQLLRNST